MFKDFVNTYGTHFSTNTYMGVKIYAERRYSASEKKEINDADLKRCNTENAIKVVKFQLDPDTDQCKAKARINERISSPKISRIIVSTYGSFLTKNVPDNERKEHGLDWSEFLKSLMRMKKFTPRVIKRELVLILRYEFQYKY